MNAMKEEVVVGITAGGRWSMAQSNDYPNGPQVIPFDTACEQIAAHFKCTKEDAAESLRRNGYAFCRKAHWHIKGGSVQGAKEDRW